LKKQIVGLERQIEQTMAVDQQTGGSRAAVA
jgi:hypothetical protein